MERFGNVYADCLIMELVIQILLALDTVFELLSETADTDTLAVIQAYLESTE